MTQLKKNVYFVAIGQFSQKLLAFLLIPFAARGLGEAGFGRFSLASSLMFVVVLLNDWGMNTYVTREIAKEKTRFPHLFWNTVALKTLLIGIDYGLLAMYLQIAGYDRETNSAILVFALYGICSSFMQLVVAVFEGFERMAFEAIVFTFEKVLITLFGLYLLQKQASLLLFCAAFPIGGIFSLLVAWYLMRKYFPYRAHAIHLSDMRDIFSNSFPFGVSLIFATIYNTTGILILSLKATSQEVGWFSAGFKLINITNVVPLILIGAVYPALSSAIHEGQNERIRLFYNQGFKYLYFLSLPLIAGGMILAPRVISLIFGEAFGPSIPVLRIMVWTAGLVFFNLYFTGILKAANLQRTMVTLQGIALGINLIINLWLISWSSYLGAAMATVLTELFIFISYFVVIHSKVSPLVLRPFVIKGIVATGVMILFLFMFSSLSLVMLMGLAMMVLLIMLFLVRGVTVAEVLPLKQWVGKR